MFQMFMFCATVPPEGALNHSASKKGLQSSYLREYLFFNKSVVLDCTFPLIASSAFPARQDDWWMSTPEGRPLSHVERHAAGETLRCNFRPRSALITDASSLRHHIPTPLGPHADGRHQQSFQKLRVPAVH